MAQLVELHPVTKACEFHSRSGHIPALQIWFPIPGLGACGWQPIDASLSVDISLPCSLSKSNEKNVLRWGLKIFLIWLFFKRERERESWEWEREREIERVKHWFVVPLVDAFIGWFLYVPWFWWEVGDEAPTNWATSPGLAAPILKTSFPQSKWWEGEKTQPR